MSATFVRGITELQNSFLVTQIMEPTLMFGQLAVLLLNLCLDNRFSPANLG
jgi:hypothetical protein